MEALIGFDSQNHPFIVEYNSRFMDVFVRIVYKNGLVDPELTKESCRRLLECNPEELNNRLALIFGPYVASIRIFREKHSSSNLFLDSTKTTRISFIEYLDNVILYITDSYTKKFLAKVPSVTRFTHERNLYYFAEILKFTFGSNPTSCRYSEQQKQLAVKLYRYWTSYSTSSPVYLFEVNIFGVFCILLCQQICYFVTYSLSSRLKSCWYRHFSSQP